MRHHLKTSRDAGGYAPNMPLKSVFFFAAQAHDTVVRREARSLPPRSYHMSEVHLQSKESCALAAPYV